MKEKGVEGLPYLPISKPHQICAKAGDVILCHYQLAHTISPNTSPNIRYCVYFRLNVRKDGQHHEEPMKVSHSKIFFLIFFRISGQTGKACVNLLHNKNNLLSILYQTLKEKEWVQLMQMN
jgi:hypothetical protein